MTVKKLYILLFVSLPLFLKGQVVIDTSFARCLRSISPLAVSASGQINLTEASKVTEIRCNTGNIRSAEGLQYFTNVTTIHLENNGLDTIPDMKSLTKLVYLNIIYNDVRFLPGIDKLAALETLYAWKNQIETLPALDALTNLKELHVFHNQLTKVPSLGVKPKLRTVYLNDNQISTMADFSACPQLVNVRLYNNPVTFRELVKLTKKTGYDTLFKLNPQSILKIGYKKQIKEYDSLVLSTGLDQGVVGMKYKWFKKGVFIGETSNDSLIIQKATFSDSGTYNCQITNSAFSGVTLSTDGFSVKVFPCLDMQKLAISTTEINCLNAGSVFVNAETNDVKTFELQSNFTAKKISNSTGRFTGLAETNYSLNLTTGSGCTKKFPRLITLTQRECEEVLLSPDNDGNGDTHYFEDTGKVTIYDKRGQVVKTLSIPGEWDGSSDKGKVFSGFYVADVNNGKKLVGITVLY